MKSISKKHQIKQPTRGVKPEYINGQWRYFRRIQDSNPILLSRVHAVALVNKGAACTQ